MNFFIKNIHVKELSHLKDFDIPIAEKQTPHLIITGKNGSGKTMLLNAIAHYFENIKQNPSMFSIYVNTQKRPQDYHFIQLHANMIRQFSDNKIRLDFTNIEEFAKDYQSGDFIVAFYQAFRKPQMIEPKNPTKPIYNTHAEVRATVTVQFLNFLSDLKIQEALARNENQMEDAEEISQWFINFGELLCQIFQDKDLLLRFNYKDYSFRILTKGKEFKFTEMSDGYAAILDIVIDLILKMQAKDTLTRAYQKKGIVLIDEVETHLHLKLQKMIMPFLTKVFPNIQFIITTHSPVVLNSLDNAIAFDLEYRETINELTQYSYEAFAEGYFGVSSEPNYIQMQQERLKSLLQKC